MIKISIPSFDFTGKKEQINLITKKKGGVYILFDSNKNPMYVGQATEVNTRIYSHFTGFTNTGGFHHLLHSCSLFFEEDQTKRSIYELYLIDKLKPALNIRDKVSVLTKIVGYGTRKMPNSAKCQFVVASGRQCKNGAHSNGFCRSHGGNGITRQIFIERAIKEFEELLSE